VLEASILLLLQGLCPETVRDLIEQLGSDSPAERMEAHRRLLDAGPETLPALQAAAASADAEVAARAEDLFVVVSIRCRLTPAVRQAVPDALPRILAGAPGEWARVFLQAAVQRREEVQAEDLAPLVGPALRGATDVEAAGVLRQVGIWRIPPELTHLPEAVRGRGASVRREALQALTACGGPGAVRALRAGLRDPDSEVRGDAAEGLIELEGKAAVMDLVPLLHPSTPVLQRTTAHALRKVPAPDAAEGFRAAFETLEGPHRATLIPLLLEVARSHAVPVLAGRCGDPDPEVRVGAIQALVELDGREAGTAVLGALDDAVAAVREAGARGAGKLGASPAMPGLVRILGDLEPSNRRAAAEALAALGAREEAASVADLLSDPDDSVREEACAALVAMSAVGAAGDVRRFLGSARAEVRTSALGVLGRLGDRGSAQEIAGLLRDEEAEVRAAAAKALGSTGSREAIPGLAAALGDREDAVVREALAALGTLGARSEATAVAALLVAGREGLWAEAVETLGALGAREHRAAVAEVLETGGARAVRSAVLVLEEFEAREAMPRLQTLLTHGSEEVRVEAAFALASLGSAAGVDVLLRAGKRLTGLNGIRSPEAWRRLRREPVRDPAPDEEESFLTETLGVDWDVAFWPDARGRIARAFFRCPAASPALSLEWNALEEKYGVVLEDARVRVLTHEDTLRFWKQAFGRVSAPGETVVERRRD
jgi:HEAT repeat protein